MGQIRTADELADVLRRRKRLIGAVTGVGVGLSVLAAVHPPEIFESAAVIQVETPVVAGVSGPVGGARSAQLLQAIEQRLMTRESLLTMAARHGLFDDLNLSDDQKVARLRAAVGIQRVAPPSAEGFGEPGSVSALIVSARLDDPDHAARLANDLAQSLLDQSAASQTARARETLRFFQEEEQRVSQDLAALETELAAFRASHGAAVPIEGETSATAIAARLRDLDLDLVSLARARAVIERRDPLSGLDRRQIEELSARIAELSEERADLVGRQALLVAVPGQRPEIVGQLATYDRRLRQLQDRYAMATARLADAEMNLRLEERQHAEHFTLLERAMIPEQPMDGHAAQTAIIGSASSLGLALALALLLELMNPVIRSSAQMERQLGLRPLVDIPDIPRPGRRRRQA